MCPVHDPVHPLYHSLSFVYVRHQSHFGVQTRTAELHVWKGQPYEARIFRAYLWLYARSPGATDHMVGASIVLPCVLVLCWPVPVGGMWLLLLPLQRQSKNVVCLSMYFTNRQLSVHCTQLPMHCPVCRLLRHGAVNSLPMDLVHLAHALHCQRSPDTGNVPCWVPSGHLSISACMLHMVCDLCHQSVSAVF